jgi:hypothetical protein
MLNGTMATHGDTSLIIYMLGYELKGLAVQWAVAYDGCYRSLYERKPILTATLPHCTGTLHLESCKR